MKLSVLVDNNTYIDRYFFAEPGLSIFIEDGDRRILFDTGFSDIFLRNAAKMGIDLLNLDYLALSHCHLDHTWGLVPLISQYTSAEIEQRKIRRPEIIAHPEIFTSSIFQGAFEIGSVLSADKISKHFPLRLSDSPVRLTERLFFLGQIPRLNDFESQAGPGRKEGADADDFLPDDSALAYRTDRGLIIITGCSHSGICNITEYAKQVCDENRVLDIIGGLHLLSPGKRQLAMTAEYLGTLNLENLYACHCTDFNSRKYLAETLPQREVGVGLTVTY